MATQAAKMMLFQNGKPFTAQLLRVSLRAGAINTVTKSNAESLINSQYFLGRQSAAAADGGLDIGASTDVSILNRQFGVFGSAEMGRVETRGKKTVADDSDDSDSDSDDSDVSDSVVDLYAGDSDDDPCRRETDDDSD